MTVRVGLVGLGFMGRMHLAAYGKIKDAEVVAIADQDERRASGDLAGGWGNIDGGIERLDMTCVTGTTDWKRLIALDDVDVVDICLPTPAHDEVATAALAAGKHVLCEKPLALTSQATARIVEAANSSKGMFMPAMCIRFWPQWHWLKEQVESRIYGRLLGLRIERVSAPPAGWFRDGAMSGGSLLDLHIHDTDYVYYLLGKPNSVFSRGYSQYSGLPDHIMTQYIYEGGPSLVSAEGGWLGEGYPFAMRFLANFENATVDYDCTRDDDLQVFAGEDQQVNIKLEGDGYEAEIEYFIECVKNGTPPTRVTPEDALVSIRIAEAEARSIETGQVIQIE